MGEKFLPGRPVALGVVLVVLVASSVGQIEQHGVKVSGPIARKIAALSGWW
jgi:hypothetical protein